MVTRQTRNYRVIFDLVKKNAEKLTYRSNIHNH